VSPSTSSASTRARALGLVLDEVARWHQWLEQQQTLAAQEPPLKEVMDTITQIITRVLYFAIADFRVILSGPIPSSTRKGIA